LISKEVDYNNNASAFKDYYKNNPDKTKIKKI